MTKKTLLAALLTTTFMASASFAAEEHKEGGHKTDVVGITIKKPPINFKDYCTINAQFCALVNIYINHNYAPDKFYSLLTTSVQTFDSEFAGTCTSDLGDNWKSSIGGIRACMSYIWGIGNSTVNGCEKMHNMGPDLGDNIAKWKKKLASMELIDACKAYRYRNPNLIYLYSTYFAKRAANGFSISCNFYPSFKFDELRDRALKKIIAGICVRIGGAVNHGLLKECPARALRSGKC